MSIALPIFFLNWKESVLRNIVTNVKDISKDVPTVVNPDQVGFSSLNNFFQFKKLSLICFSEHYHFNFPDIIAAGNVISFPLINLVQNIIALNISMNIIVTMLSFPTLLLLLWYHLNFYANLSVSSTKRFNQVIMVAHHKITYYLW